MTISKVIKDLRISRGWSQQQLANKAGVPRPTISLIELREQSTPRYDVLEKLATAFSVSVQYLTGDENKRETPEQLWEKLKAYQPVSIPIRGVIPAGAPNVIEEESGEYLYMPRDLIKGRSDLYALKVSGDSLIDLGINPGDHIIIEPTSQIVNGKVYVVRLENQVVARRIFRDPDGIKLVAGNSNYQVITPEKVEVLGRAVLCGRWFEC